MLVEAIAVCKVKAVEDSISLVHRLKNEVGSYALMAGAGIELSFLLYAGLPIYLFRYLFIYLCVCPSMHLIVYIYYQHFSSSYLTPTPTLTQIWHDVNCTVLGFDQSDFLTCCKFAEGDSRVLMQKMSRDRYRAFLKSEYSKSAGELPLHTHTHMMCRWMFIVIMWWRGLMLGYLYLVFWLWIIEASD